MPVFLHREEWVVLMAKNNYSVKQLWETRPLECWTKAKELRAKWQHSIESEDLIVGQGNTSFTIDWQVAYPSINVIEDNPVGAMMASKSDSFSRECRLAGETRGWGREICGYHGNCWGSQFIGYQMDGSPFPERRFTVPFPDVCDSHAKRGQQCRDFSPAMPRWMSDFTMYTGETNPSREIEMIEHRNYCTYKELNGLESTFGQALNDEKLFQMIHAGHLIQKFSRDVAYYMTFVPAPLSVKDLYSFYTLGGLTKIDPQDTIDLWKSFRDEVEWRAKNQIAAVGTERYRWLEAHPPSWHFLKYYRYMEKYGAVCIGSQYTNFGASQLERKADGSIGDRDYPSYSPDMPLSTREDAVRYITGPDARAPHHFKIDEYLRPYALNEFADIYQANGALFGLWRGGVGCTFTRKEQAIHLREMGINVMLYEGSQPGDRTDLDEKRFLEQLDMWMESQGLRKLEE
jgi:benzoyl-CoA reductase subunit B